ncbi:Protein of unknown function [Pyronema omphalodes CBS 100304]|uniref:Uncharacterized protein n=1 Tax=Pyronema omphalodes (strain CBS 100304) TaxID=1076935 RepID=U4LEY6_PYROM|nr:Protein of unknown function [Pyronema omphalodes CBS 100304]
MLAQLVYHYYYIQSLPFDDGILVFENLLVILIGIFTLLKKDYRVINVHFWIIVFPWAIDKVYRDVVVQPEEFFQLAQEVRAATRANGMGVVA